MKTFKDWANTSVGYRFKLEKDVYQIGDKQWCCYLALGDGATNKDNIKESPLWSCFGTGDTKAFALKSAIQDWNIFDTVGRG
jgi:hypothetical protein